MPPGNDAPLPARGHPVAPKLRAARIWLFCTLALAPATSGSTPDLPQPENYKPADLYSAEVLLSGSAKVWSGSSDTVRTSNSIPLRVVVKNNTDAPGTFVVKASTYNHPGITNGADPFWLSTDSTTTPLLSAGEEHVFINDFHLNFSFKFTTPSSSIAAAPSHHSYKNDGSRAVFDNVYGEGIELRRAGVTLDRTNLEILVTGAIPFGGLSNHTPPRTINSAPASVIPTIYLYADPSSAPQRPGAIPEEELDTCQACAEACQISTDAKLGSLLYTIAFPPDTFGEQRAFRLRACQPHPKITDPGALQLDYELDSIKAAGQLRQIATATELALIDVASPDRYTIHFYHLADAGPADADGIHSSPTGAAHTSIVVEDPDPGNGDTQVQFTRTTGSKVEVSHYQFDPATDRWALANADGRRVESIATAAAATLAAAETETREVKDAGGGLISKSTTAYAHFPFGRRTISHTIDPDGRNLTTSYSYYEDEIADGDNYGYLHHRTTPTGHWTHFEYDAAGRVVKEVSPHTNPAFPAADYDGTQDAALRVMTHSYDDFPAVAGAPHETHVTTLFGCEISRRYVVRHPDGEDRIDAQSPGAAHTAPDNLVTRQRHYTDGDFKHEPARTEFPDGTLSITSYSTDTGSTATATTRTTTSEVGEPAPGGLGIIDGTRSVTVRNRQGNVLSRTTTDIATSIVLSQQTATEVDAFGRTITVQHLDGTTTTTHYDCCGIAESTDRTGVHTEFDHTDALASSQIRLGVQTVTAQGEDARPGGGSTETQTRTAVDPDGAPIAGTTTLLSRREYNAAGDLVAEYSPPANAAADPDPTNLAARRLTTSSESVDASGHTIATTTGPDGTTSVTESFADGRLAKVNGTGTRGRRYSYGVEPPAAGAYPRPYTQEILLDAAGADTAEWTKTYTDLLGRESHTLTSAGALTVRTYDAAGKLASQTDPDGVTLLYAYDARGRLDTTAVDMDRDGLIDFDGNDRITRTTTEAADRNGVAVVRTITEVFTASGDGTRTAKLSRLETSTDGLQSWSTREGQSSHTETIYAGSGNHITTITYADGTKRESATLGGRLHTVTSLDNTGAQITATSYGYDALGRNNRVSDARNGDTDLVYFIDDRLQSTTTPDPDGAGPETRRTTSFTYDVAGRRELVTLPDGETVGYHYLPTGELQSVGGARTYSASYTYDHAGRLKTLTAGSGTTTWNYFATSGHPESKRYADGKGPTFTYTAAGRPLTRTLARGGHRRFAYDNAGQLQHVAYFTDATETAADTTTPPESYSYDRVGNLESLTDAAGLHHFTTTPSGRVERETIAGGILDGADLDPAYDPVQRRESLTFGALGAAPLTHSYRYDDAGRYRQIAAGENPATSPGAAYTYLPNSNLPHTTTSNAADGGGKLILTRSFDAINRLTSISSVSTGTTDPLDTSDTFDHSRAGHRQRVTLADGGYWQYRYDALGQLESASRHLADDTPVESQCFDFTYDSIGNRLSSKNGAPSHPATSYTPSDLNQYTSVSTPATVWITGEAQAAATITVDGQTADRPGASSYFEFQATTEDHTDKPVITTFEIEAELAGQTHRAYRHARTPTGTAEPSYDDDGNLEADAFYHYTWNGENRLVAIETHPDLPADFPQQRLEFTYDSLGRRIEKKVFGKVDGAWHPAGQRRFLYDGWNLLAEYEPRANGEWQACSSFLWGTDLSGTLQGAGGTSGLLHLRDHVEDKGYFAAYDGMGNLSALVDDRTGETQATYSYAPFGGALSTTGPAAHLNPFRFSTRYLDNETGLYYYGFRYYDTTAGRWLNRDPIGEEGGLNLYGFVGNDGVNRWDYLGLTPELWTMSGINNYSEQSGIFIDYVQDELSAQPGLGAYRSSVSIASKLGTKKNYKVDNNVLIGSTKKLDREARQVAARRTAKRGLCPKKINIMMIAPKTNTKLVKKSESCCCINEVEIHWSPYDEVPNQGPTQTKAIWYRYYPENGSKHADSLRVHNVKSGHALGGFLKPHHPTKKPTGGGINNRKYVPSISATVVRWMKDPTVDIVIICHSQGCNIAMHVVNRGCSKSPQ